ncbi:hypothetical protein EWM64_g2287 [Hericium alpestre]|uniref:Uncharacterized protein n=1 Tax=Hericium alpestre TaxID=135208 RepID=A0A4Z0A5W7_9AGAM|nr:hypothetical protein EWM64_g2287 [Hericium alpestre]
MNLDGQLPPGSGTPSPKRKKAFQTSPGSPRKRPRLLAESSNTTHEWFRRPNTSQQYANYVKAGKEWLHVWVTESEDSSDKAEEPAGASQVSEADVPTEDVESTAPGLGSTSLEDRRQYGDAFDSITDKTPDALRLFTAWKCEILGRQYSTAEAIRAAFKDYFEQFEDLVNLKMGHLTWHSQPDAKYLAVNVVFTKVRQNINDGSNTTAIHSETTAGFDVLPTASEPIASVAAPVVQSAPTVSLIAPAPHPDPAIAYIGSALHLTPTTSPFISSTPPGPAAGYGSPATPFEPPAAPFGSPAAPFESPAACPTPVTSFLISSVHPAATGYISPAASSEPPAARPTLTAGLIIPTIHSLSDVIRYWEIGDIHHGLTVPLGKWRPNFYRSAQQRERVKWANASHVYEEYCRLGKDLDRFNEEYPGLQGDNKYSQLLDAVRERRKALGIIKPRVRKK